MIVGLGIISALISAILQAFAHALLKSGRDKLIIRGLIGLTGALVMAPLCAYAPAPTGYLWAWLIASNATHAIYQLVLIRAYERQDFAIAYPMARGVAPLVTTFLGVVLLHDKATLIGVFGVFGITLGLLSLARSAVHHQQEIRAALVAGVLTSLYTLIDAGAVRLADNPWTFIAWFFLFDGLIMVTVAMCARGRRTWKLIRAEGGKGFTAGLASLVTYTTALLALRLLPTGSASALRETSVVFGAVIAYVLLKERMDYRRISGAALVAAGGILIVLGLGAF